MATTLLTVIFFAMLALAPNIAGLIISAAAGSIRVHFFFVTSSVINGLILGLCTLALTFPNP